MDSESESESEGESESEMESERESERERERESESETTESEDEARIVQERWEAFAGLADYARRLDRLEALDTVLPYLPEGPQALALEHALLNSKDLPATLRAVERAALAMARAEDLVRLA